MKPGSWVVCVDDSDFPPLAAIVFSSLPVQGRTYRVRRLIDDYSGQYGGEPGIALEGIWADLFLRQTLSGQVILEEYHFFMRRFREVDPPFGEEVDNEVLLETLCAN